MAAVVSAMSVMPSGSVVPTPGTMEPEGPPEILRRLPFIGGVYFFRVCDLKPTWTLASVPITSKPAVKTLRFMQSLLGFGVPEGCFELVVPIFNSGSTRALVPVSGETIRDRPA